MGPGLAKTPCNPFIRSPFLTKRALIMHKYLAHLGVSITSTGEAFGKKTYLGVLSG